MISSKLYSNTYIFITILKETVERNTSIFHIKLNLVTNSNNLTKLQRYWKYVKDITKNIAEEKRLDSRSRMSCQFQMEGRAQYHSVGLKWD